MSSVSTTDAGAARRRRRLTTAIKESLRELRSQLGLLNHRVGAHLDLRDIDLDCLELLNRHGPLSPSALARRAGLHPALRDRAAELFRLFGGMNSAMDRLCAGYSEEQLELVADFLRRTTTAGRHATDELAG